jgi:hypothetical protein
MKRYPKKLREKNSERIRTSIAAMLEWIMETLREPAAQVGGALDQPGRRVALAGATVKVAPQGSGLVDRE